MALATTITLQVQGILTGTSGLTSGAVTPTSQIAKALSLSWATGTTLDKADQIYASTRTLATSTAETLDMAGSLTNDLGASIVFARVKLLFIAVTTATAGYYLEVGGNASAQFSSMFGDVSDKLIVRGGGFACLCAPDATAYVTAAGSTDILKINNPSAASVTYDIIIIGATA